MLLTRVARRRPLKRHQWTSSDQQRWRSTPAGDLSRFRAHRALANRYDIRAMATTSDMAHSPSHEELPFSSLGTSTYRAPSEAPLAMPYSYAQPFIIHDSVATSAYRRLESATYRDINELQQNLYACLAVGRLDRAEGIVRRIGERFGHCQELYEAKKQVLRSLVNQLDGNDAAAVWIKIRRWFEVEILVEAEFLDFMPFVLMLRGAFIASSGVQQERAMRRYLGLAEAAGPHIVSEILESGEFSPSEQEVIFRSQPHKFEMLPSRNDATSAQPKQQDIRSTKREPIDFRAVEQRGLGLSSLQKTLLPLHSPDEFVNLTDAGASTGDEANAFAHRLQECVEENGTDAAIERWRVEHDNMLKMGINTALSRRSMSSLLWEWHSAMIHPVRDQLKRIRHLLDQEGQNKSSSTDTRLEWGPYIEHIPVERLCATTILTVLNSFVEVHSNQQKALAEGMSISLTSLVASVGQHVENLAKLASPNSSNHGQKATDARKPKQPSNIRVRSTIPGQKSHGESSESNASAQPLDLGALKREVYDQWPHVVKTRIAAFLVTKLVDCARISVTATHPRTKKTETALLPAFNHSYRYLDGRRYGILLTHPQLVKLLCKEPVRGVLGSRLPMVVPPKPWTGYKDGGYLKYPLPVVRASQQDETLSLYIAAAAERGDLKYLFDGLNVLGKTPWRINDRVLKVMAEAWNSGEALAKIPPDNPDLPIPPEPSPTEPDSARFKWRNRVREIGNIKSGFHSNRCYMNFQLETANAFRGHDMYFPHNVDFRGRAYPIPPTLNHMGSDRARGLMHFAKGKELGVVGLRWLKIHMANLFGYDKASFSEREEFVMDHLADIYDSATNPLSGKRWWSKAEDPWQFLAACFELKDALDSPDPHRFVSYIPVHQDGTCNGLQHYAALGGDPFGASQVNLEPGERPQDVYTGVAQLVIAQIDKDAALEKDCQDKKFAMALQGQITRKVVKQTVMTNVYGVTFTGARAQVYKQLKDIREKRGIQDPENETFFHAMYITTKIFNALATMFEGAHGIQKWFGVCAGRICDSVSTEQIDELRSLRERTKQVKLPGTLRRGKKNQISESDVMELKTSLIWTTPLKVPVVQPYRKPKQRTIHTDLQNFTFNVPTKSEPVSKRRQMQGFPPNFIHSLDATHMLLSALKCDELNLTFAAVHDSFWTHAADIPTISRVLRDAFIRMHQEDVIGRLKAEFEARYKGHYYQEEVLASSDVGREIRAWRKQQPLGQRSQEVQYTELIKEFERQQLLASEDPKDREKGQAMVTPASLYEAVSSDSSTLIDNESVASGLGQVPESQQLDNLEMDADEIDEEGLPQAEMQQAGEEQSQNEEEGSESRPATKGKSKQPKPKIRFWRPLTFPDVPTKGEWDVSRLKESQYFFS